MSKSNTEKLSTPITVWWAEATYSIWNEKTFFTLNDSIKSWSSITFRGSISVAISWIISAICRSILSTFTSWPKFIVKFSYSSPSNSKNTFGSQVLPIMSEKYDKSNPYLGISWYGFLAFKNARKETQWRINDYIIFCTNVLIN